MRSLWSKASYKYRIGGGRTMHYRSLDSVYKDKIALAQIKTIQEYWQKSARWIAGARSAAGALRGSVFAPEAP